MINERQYGLMKRETSVQEKYLVTGAAGHLGSVIIRELLNRGKSVRALILPDEKNLPEGDIEICRGDVRDKNSLVDFFRNQENDMLILIHCAGIVSISSRFVQEIYDVNVIGTKNIVDLCEQQRIEKLVYVSSVHAIPEGPKGDCIVETEHFAPDNVVGLYAKTKAEATSYVLAAGKRGLNVNIVHPTGICGPYDNGRGHLTTLVIDYYQGRLIAGMEGGYDFVDVRDVASGIISCFEKGVPGECYILSNKYYTVRELLDMLHEVTGKKRIKIILPYWFVRLTARLSENYYKILRQPPLYTAYSVYTLSSNALFSHQKASDALGYTTRDMKQTLADTVSWLKREGRI